MKRPMPKCANHSSLTFLVIFISTLLVMHVESAGQTPLPPGDVSAADHPLDRGNKIDLTWTLSPDDPASVAGYNVYRTLTPETVAKVKVELDADVQRLEKQIQAHPERETLKKLLRQACAVRDDAVANKPTKVGKEAVKAGEDELKTRKVKHTVEDLEPGHEYIFHVKAVSNDGNESEPASSAVISPHFQFFDGERINLVVIVLVLCGSIITFILLARSGVPMKIRRIAGLEAVDEAVGRATEMGRPILFVPGIQDMNDMMTLAGLTALGHVAKKAAEYDAKLEVPTSRSLVMTAARETVHAAFLAAGRPDAYNQDLIYYVTDEQFGYVAYLSGHMARAKPAACFYLGAFFAESLILAETGNAVGAIQIAGTAETAQLPFFVAACDYTLIGEEFYAASAYLSGEPDQLGSLRGQDVGKTIVALGLLAGCLLATIVSLNAPDPSVKPRPQMEEVLETFKTKWLK